MTSYCFQSSDGLYKHEREEKNLEGLPQFLGNMKVQVFVQESACYPQDSEDRQQGQNPQAQSETGDPFLSGFGIAPEILVTGVYVQETQTGCKNLIEVPPSHPQHYDEYRIKLQRVLPGGGGQIKMKLNPWGNTH